MLGRFMFEPCHMDEVEFHAPPRKSNSKRWLSFHPFSGIYIYININMYTVHVFLPLAREMLSVPVFPRSPLRDNQQVPGPWRSYAQGGKLGNFGSNKKGGRNQQKHRGISRTNSDFFFHIMDTVNHMALVLLVLSKHVGFDQ